MQRGVDKAGRHRSAIRPVTVRAGPSASPLPVAEQPLPVLDSVPKARTYDFLVLGSGIAGLSYALKVHVFQKQGLSLSPSLTPYLTPPAEGLSSEWSSSLTVKQAATHGSVAVVTKEAAKEGSTQWAQGGVCAVLGEYDTPEAHIEDTVVAGDFLNDRKCVCSALSSVPWFCMLFLRQRLLSFCLKKRGCYAMLCDSICQLR